MFKEKIIFMGTPEISASYLECLIQNKFNIFTVYTQPPRKKSRGMLIQKSPVHQLAISNEIKVFTPLNFNNDEIRKQLEFCEPDLIIIMGYGLKLPNYLLNIPKLGCINIHVSLLPRWRGSSPIEHALLNGDQETGITIFKLVEKMDAGPIIASKKIKIEKNTNKDSLVLKLNSIGTNFLIENLPNILKKKNVFIEQDENKVTYSSKITTDVRKIDFTKNIDTIINKIKAFSVTPGAWFLYNNERIKIIKSTGEIGTYKLSTIVNNKFHIGCKDGKICPEIIQREGKKPMHIDDFLRGFKFMIGEKINE